MRRLELVRTQCALSSAKVLWELEAIGLAKFSGAIVQVREGPHCYSGYNDKQGEVTLLHKGEASHPAASYGCCLPSPPGNSQHLSIQVELSEEQVTAGICTSGKSGLESAVQGGECTMFVDEVIGRAKSAKRGPRPEPEDFQH